MIKPGDSCLRQKSQRMKTYISSKQVQEAGKSSHYYTWQSKLQTELSRRIKASTFNKEKNPSKAYNNDKCI